MRGQAHLQGRRLHRKQHKIQPSTPAYEGNFNFSPDTNNGLGNTTNGYANALLGYVDSYSQTTARAVFNSRIGTPSSTSRTTGGHLQADLGYRSPLLPPDAAGGPQQYVLEFFPSQYSQGCRAAHLHSRHERRQTRGHRSRHRDRRAGRLYRPVRAEQRKSGRRHAPARRERCPLAPYNQSPLALAPRFGFAYDLTGDGKTALRGGFGIYLQPSGWQPGIQLSRDRLRIPTRPR